LSNSHTIFLIGFKPPILGLEMRGSWLWTSASYTVLFICNNYFTRSIKMA